MKKKKLRERRSPLKKTRAFFKKKSSSCSREAFARLLANELNRSSPPHRNLAGFIERLVFERNAFFLVSCRFYSILSKWNNNNKKKRSRQQKSSSCFPPLFVLFFRLLLTFCIPQIKEREREREREKREERREKREKGGEFFSLSLLLSFSGRRTKGRNPPMAPKERTKDPRKKKFASHLSC